MKSLTVLLFALLTLSCVAATPAAASGADKVTVKTYCDTSAIVPGKPFEVGFEFTIEPGWHIYWKNPGDSGLATQVKISLPEGWKAGELAFPVPARLDLAGGILNYAYENQVMLTVLITPSKDLALGKPITIGAKASWLVCQDECVPGNASLSIELPVAASATAANVGIFQQWRDRLPLKEDSDDIASLSNAIAVANGDGQATVDIAWKKPGTDVQFIPGPLANGDVENIKVVTTVDSTKIHFVIKGFKGDEAVTGLLIFKTTAGERRGIEISIPPSTVASHQ